MKMNPWTLSVLLLLAGAGADPDCTTTPNVYNSRNIIADNRFLYLGDLVGNCTSKIIKTVKRDTAMYRFRIVTNGDQYTGPRGVMVTVTDGEDVKVRSSVTDNVVKEGGQVTLTCTSACSFHQLDVHWYRNGHALSETSPALHLSNLANDDTGDYTCSLDSSGQKTSAPWSLVVLVDEGFHRSVHLVVAVVKGVVLAVLLLLLAGVVFPKWLNQPSPHTLRRSPRWQHGSPSSCGRDFNICNKPV
ncbi:unnamed protein product [Gadus morhua 'NCC']